MVYLRYLFIVVVNVDFYHYKLSPQVCFCSNLISFDMLHFYAWLLSLPFVFPRLVLELNFQFFWAHRFQMLSAHAHQLSAKAHSCFGLEHAQRACHGVEGCMGETPQWLLYGSSLESDVVSRSNIHLIHSCSLAALLPAIYTLQSSIPTIFMQLSQSSTLDGGTEICPLWQHPI